MLTADAPASAPATGEDAGTTWPGRAAAWIVSAALLVALLAVAHHFLTREDRAIVRLVTADALGRSMAACELARMKSVTAVPALLRTLDDEERMVRWSAVLSLGEISRSALGREEKRRVAVGLAKVLRDGDRSVRYSAALALGGIGPPAREVVGDLVAGLKDSQAIMRAYCAQALGGIGPEAAPAAPALRELLEDRAVVLFGVELMEMTLDILRAGGLVDPEADAGLRTFTKAGAAMEYLWGDRKRVSDFAAEALEKIERG